MAADSAELPHLLLHLRYVLFRPVAQRQLPVRKVVLFFSIQIIFKLAQCGGKFQIYFFSESFNVSVRQEYLDMLFFFLNGSNKECPRFLIEEVAKNLALL